MKVSNIRKGVLFVVAAGWLALGCELLVDFDRTKIPVEGTDAAAVSPEASTDASGMGQGDSASEAATGDAATGDSATGDAAGDAADAADDAADAAAE